MEPRLDPGSPPPSAPGDSRATRVIAAAGLVGLLLLVIALPMLTGTPLSDRPMPVVRQTSIGQVLTLVREHQIASATLRGDQMTVTDAHGTIYVATREDGQPLTPYLLDNGVMTMTVQPPEGTPLWSQIVQNAVPLVIVVVLTVVLLLIARRRLAVDGTDQARAFARSRPSLKPVGVKRCCAERPPRVAGREAEARQTVQRQHPERTAADAAWCQRGSSQGVPVPLSRRFRLTQAGPVGHYLEVHRIPYGRWCYGRWRYVCGPRDALVETLSERLPHATLWTDGASTLIQGGVAVSRVRGR
jgi:hypothetical protein